MLFYTYLSIITKDNKKINTKRTAYGFSTYINYKLNNRSFEVDDNQIIIHLPYNEKSISNFFYFLIPNAKEKLKEMKESIDLLELCEIYKKIDINDRNDLFNFYNNFYFFVFEKYQWNLPEEYLENDNFKETVNKIISEFIYMSPYNFNNVFHYFFSFFLRNIEKFQGKFILPLIYNELDDTMLEIISEYIEKFNEIVIFFMDILLDSMSYYNSIIQKLECLTIIEPEEEFNYRIIEKYENLKYLEFSFCHDKHKSTQVLAIPHLNKIKYLKIVDFKGKKIEFQPSITLKSLTIIGLRLNQFDFKSLSDLYPNLEYFATSIEFSNIEIEIEDFIEPLKSFKKLKKLAINDSVFMNNKTKISIIENLGIEIHVYGNNNKNSICFTNGLYKNDDLFLKFNDKLDFSFGEIYKDKSFLDSFITKVLMVGIENYNYIDIYCSNQFIDTLFLNKMMIDIKAVNVINKMKYLKDIHLINCDIKSDAFEIFIERFKFDITNLSFEHINLNITKMLLIENLKNLKTFEFCTIDSTLRSNDIINLFSNLKFEDLKSLENLYLISNTNFMANIFEKLLKLKNLRNIFIYPTLNSNEKEYIYKIYNKYDLYGTVIDKIKGDKFFCKRKINIYDN